MKEFLLLQIKHPTFGWITVEEIAIDQVDFAFETCGMYQKLDNINTRIIHPILTEPWDTILEEVLHLDITTTQTAPV